jgi:hypothetical protein
LRRSEFAVASGCWAMENPSAIKGIDSPRELKYLSNSLAAQTAFDAGNSCAFSVIGPYSVFISVFIRRSFQAITLALCQSIIYS